MCRSSNWRGYAVNCDIFAETRVGGPGVLARRHIFSSTLGKLSSLDTTNPHLPSSRLAPPCPFSTFAIPAFRSLRQPHDAPMTASPYPDSSCAIVSVMSLTNFAHRTLPPVEASYHCAGPTNLDRMAHNMAHKQSHKMDVRLARRVPHSMECELVYNISRSMEPQ